MMAVITKQQSSFFITYLRFDNYPACAGQIPFTFLDFKKRGEGGSGFEKVNSGNDWEGYLELHQTR